MKMKELSGGKTSRVCTGEDVWIVAVGTGQASAVNWCVIGTAVTYITVKFSSVLMLL